MQQTQEQSKSSSVIDVAIIGGGASGLALAAFLSQALSEGAGEARSNTTTLAMDAETLVDTAGAASNIHTHHRPSIVLFEASKRVGTPILRSGNGRCNFSNTNVNAAAYYHRLFVQQVFNALGEASHHSVVREWLYDLGLLPGETFEDGALYPLSNKASSVLDVLRLSIDEELIEEKLECSIQSVEALADASVHYRITTTEGKQYQARFVVLACGSKADIALPLPASQQRSFQPVLVPLQIKRPPKWLDGVRVKGCLSLPKKHLHEKGEVLFRAYGISGIAAFNLSRFVQPHDEIEFDCMPHYSESDMEALLMQRTQRFTKRGVQDILVGMFVSGVARLILEQAGLSAQEKVSPKAAKQLAHTIKHLTFVVEGPAKQQPQVWRGGITVESVVPQTLEVRRAPGLFVLGEALDVDGPCGGYNLHWAWSCALVAGQALVARLQGQGE